jgi:LacI family transcriptional regulator
MATIYDVAKEAGVSIGTVSYVFNKPGRVAEKTAQAVLAAAEKLNYRPSASARALAQGSANTITILTPAETFDSQTTLNTVINAITQTLASSKYRSLIRPIPATDEAWQALQSDVFGRQMDGAILLQVRPQDERVDLLRSSQIPFVMVGRCEHAENDHFVDADSRATALMAINHLYILGHRRIAVIGENDGTNLTNLLISSAREVVRELDLDSPEAWFAPVDSEPEACARSVEATLSQFKRPTAIFALSDAVVMSTIRACARLGLKIPEDVALIGYADSNIYPYLTPPVSAVFSGAAALGNKAAEILLKQLREQSLEPMQILIQPELTIRQSSKKRFHTT